MHLCIGLFKAYYRAYFTFYIRLFSKTLVTIHDCQTALFSKLLQILKVLSYFVLYSSTRILNRFRLIEIWPYFISVPFNSWIPFDQEVDGFVKDDILVVLIHSSNKIQGHDLKAKKRIWNRDYTTEGIKIIDLYHHGQISLTDPTNDFGGKIILVIS